MEILKIKKLVKEAILPTRAYDTDAGLDLYTIQTININANTNKAVPTGIAMKIPKGYYGQIEERSGYSLDNLLTIKAGVIDSSYIGEIKIIMQNTGYEPVRIPAGTKVAQLVIHKLPNIKIEEVEILENTDRGEKGFGSSDSNINQTK